MPYTPGGFPYDGSALPGDLENGDLITAAQWNDHIAKLTNGANNTAAGDYHGNRDMSGGMPDAAPSGQARWTAEGGEVKWSRNGRQWRQQWHDRSIEEFGITFDSTGDAVLIANSAALADAAEWALEEVTAQRFARLVIPPRYIAFAETWVPTGTQAGAPAIVCALEGGVPFNSIKATLAWYGDPDEVAVYWESMNRGLLRDIEIDGRSIAGTCLQIGASTFADPSIIAATSGPRIIRCRLKHVRPGVDGNGCLAMGTDPDLTGEETFQASEFLFSDVDCIPEDSGHEDFDVDNIQGYGIKNLSGGNCKNGTLDHATFSAAKVALDLTADSGAWFALNCQFGNVRTAISHNDSQLTVINGDMECNFGAAKALVGGTSGAGAVRLIGFQCAVGAGANANLVEYYGQFTVENSYFFNAGLAFWLKVAAGAGGYGSVRSVQNNYRNCGASLARPYAPFRDGSDNDLAPQTGYGAENALGVISELDVDDKGDGGALLHLKPFNSSAQTAYSLALNGPFQPKFLATASDGVTLGNPTTLSVDATAGNRTANLPAAAAANKGRIHVVVKSDASGNTVTVSGVVLANQHEAAMFQSTGAAWQHLKFI